MSTAGAPKWSLRLERAESSRLAWAFIISISLHLTIFGTYELGKKFNIWQNLHWPAWLHPIQLLVQKLKKPEPPPQQQEVPLMFVDVSPAQVTAEPPKDAKFYSDKNSKAANPDQTKGSDMPNIAGTQTQVVRTEDVPRNKFVPLQPAPPPPQPQAQPAPEPQEEMKPKPAQPPGDLAMAKPEPVVRKDTGQAEQSRPRTIKEALARLQPDNRLAGQKMKQEGGVPRHAVVSSVDTRATPFGAYDAALIHAVQDHWYSLLDQRDYASDAHGKVVLQFQLHYDGRITDVTIAENTAGEVSGLICQKAILDPAPFGVWPSDMRRMAGDTRFIVFTFYYN
jgi:outer membrane biosynthesis protein TonB